MTNPNDNWRGSETERVAKSKLSQDAACKHAQECKVPCDCDGRNWSWVAFFTTGKGIVLPEKKD